MQSAKVNRIDSFRAADGSRPRPRVRQALLAVQIGLGVVLAVGAGLFVRSVREVHALDFGIDIHRMLLVTADFVPAGYDAAEANAAYLRLLEDVREHPLVEAAGLSISLPFMGGAIGAYFRMPDAGLDPDRPAPNPMTHAVTPDYFAAAGLEVVAGRSFNAADQAGAPPVALVNEMAAQWFWPGENAVGQCLFTYETSQCFEVIGVVENTRGSILRESSGTEWFLPLAQHEQASSQPHPAIRGMVVRTGHPDRAAPTLAQFIRASSPDLPYVHVQPFWEVLDAQTRSWRLGATMFSFFGAAALALAAVGVFSLLAFSVRQRRPEIAVRLAVGAGPRQILWMIVREGLRVVAVGWIIGLAGALLLARAVSGLLFGVAPFDPMSLLTATATVGAAAVLASLIPALRAARVAPAAVLRRE